MSSAQNKPHSQDSPARSSPLATRRRRLCSGSAIARSSSVAAMHKGDAAAGARLHGRCERLPQACVCGDPARRAWQAREKFLAAMPKNLGAPERAARQCMPLDLYVESAAQAVSEYFARFEQKRSARAHDEIFRVSGKVWRVVPRFCAIARRRRAGQDIGKAGRNFLGEDDAHSDCSLCAGLGGGSRRARAARVKRGHQEMTDMGL